MTEYGTIKLPREEYERHNERRQDLGLTWAEYINGEAPEDERWEWLEARIQELPERTADELEARQR